MKLLREMMKLDESGVEEREEKKKDLEKVKSARYKISLIYHKYEMRL